MPVATESFSKNPDVYIDFPQEEVMFHYVRENGRVFRKFYDDPTEDEVSYTSDLFNEARIVGDETTADHYNSLVKEGGAS